MNSNLSELELQNLRHLISAHETVEKKWSDYASRCTSRDVKDYLEQGANSARTTKETFMSYLK